MFLALLLLSGALSDFEVVVSEDNGDSGPADTADRSLHTNYDNNQSVPS